VLSVDPPSIKIYSISAFFCNLTEEKQASKYWLALNVTVIKETFVKRLWLIMALREQLLGLNLTFLSNNHLRNLKLPK
jgi:hypothetical protein